MSVLNALVSLIEGLPEPTLLFDSEYNILGVNAAYEAIFKESSETMLGHKCHQFLHHSDHPCGTEQHPCPLQIAQRTGQRAEDFRIHIGLKGPRRVRVELIPIASDESGKQYFLNRVHYLPPLHQKHAQHELVGEAPAFRQMMNLVERVATSNATILLLGESGTGKELVARAIHEMSGRKDQNFVAIDCSGLPETLFESELFGHERGAFTGATQARAGLLESAHGGTLFIDEVGDIPSGLQVKLLRFLETGTYRRLGSSAIRHADVRLISATHQPLAELVKQRAFREDLYYRLNTFPIRLPSLKERISDIPILTTTLLRRISQREDHHYMIEDAAVDYLKTLELRGNIRELRNILERAAILSTHSVIDVASLQQALRLELTSNHGSLDQEMIETQMKPLKALQDDLLAEMLQHYQGNRRALAEALGISERTLYRKLSRIAG